VIGLLLDGFRGLGSRCRGACMAWSFDAFMDGYKELHAGKADKPISWRFNCIIIN